jgi:hypothetical protein
MLDESKRPQARGDQARLKIELVFLKVYKKIQDIRMLPTKFACF